LVRSARETRTNKASTINTPSSSWSTGLPDKSGSAILPFGLAMLIHVDRLLVLTMNSQIHGTQIHPEGLRGLTAGAGVSRGGEGSGGAARDEAGGDWIKRDARDGRAG
jgi:hypothetical protein